MTLKRYVLRHRDHQEDLTLVETEVGFNIFLVEGDTEYRYGHFAACDLCGCIEKMDLMAINTRDSNFFCRPCVLDLFGQVEAKLMHHNQRQYEIRRAAKAIEVPSVLPNRVMKAVRIQVFNRDMYRCRYCGRFDPHMAVDHIIPQVQGGSHLADNLVACCGECNSRKGGRTPEEAGMHILPIGTIA